MSVDDCQIASKFQCAMCAGTKETLYIKMDVYSIVRCLTCNALLTSPIPSARNQQEHYEKNYYSNKDGNRFRFGIATVVQGAFRKIRARTMRRHLPHISGRKILDIGCGRGEVLQQFKKWGADVYGIELSGAAADVAAMKIGNTRIIRSELNNMHFSSQYFDVITMWHVLEHVRHPVNILQNVARLLKPDGIGYIEVPNAAGRVATTWKKSWLGYDLPNHLTHFSIETLKDAADRGGLECIEWQFWSAEYDPMTLLQTILNAWLGGENILFSLLTHEQKTGTKKSERISVIKRSIHLTAAIFLLVPVFVASWILARKKMGDTIGVYVRPAL